jgi:hydrogenase expression/formation protein HypD
MVYSPLDAVKLAEQNPDQEVVFFGVGFETTAPGDGDGGVSSRTEGAEEFLPARFARARAAGD